MDAKRDCAKRILSVEEDLRQLKEMQKELEKHESYLSQLYE